MGGFNPVKTGISIAPLVIGGVAIYEGFLVLTGTEPFIGPDPINEFLKSFLGDLGGILGGGGNGNGNGGGDGGGNGGGDGGGNGGPSPGPGPTPTPTPTPRPRPGGERCYGGRLSTNPLIRDRICATTCRGRCSLLCMCKECTTGPCAGGA